MRVTAPLTFPFPIKSYEGLKPELFVGQQVYVTAVNDISKRLVCVFNDMIQVNHRGDRRIGKIIQCHNQDDINYVVELDLNVDETTWYSFFTDTPDLRLVPIMSSVTGADCKHRITSIFCVDLVTVENAPDYIIPVASEHRLAYSMLDEIEGPIACQYVDMDADKASIAIAPICTTIDLFDPRENHIAFELTDSDFNRIVHTKFNTLSFILYSTGQVKLSNIKNVEGDSATAALEAIADWRVDVTDINNLTPAEIYKLANIIEGTDIEELLYLLNSSSRTMLSINDREIAISLMTLGLTMPEYPITSPSITFTLNSLGERVLQYLFYKKQGRRLIVGMGYTVAVGAGKVPPQPPLTDKSNVQVAMDYYSEVYYDFSAGELEMQSCWSATMNLIKSEGLWCALELLHEKESVVIADTIYSEVPFKLLSDYHLVDVTNGVVKHTPFGDSVCNYAKRN